MDDIARALNKAKSTLYLYFDSKEKVFQAVLEIEGELLVQKVETAIAHEATPQAKLRAYALTRFLGIKKLTNFYRSLSYEYQENYKFIEQFRKKFDKYEMDLIKHILQQGNDADIFAVADPETTAAALVMALKGLEYPLAIKEKSVRKLEHKITIMLDVLLNGILRRQVV